jgi:hypothetical protein
MSSQITLYVRSKRTAVKNVRTGKDSQTGYGVTPGAGSGRSGMRPDVLGYYVPSIMTKYDFVLPEDQQRMIENVKEAASRFGFDLEIVDLARRNAFSRWRLEHSKRIKTLPALMTDSGEIVEGVKTKEEIEALLTKEPKSAT